MAVIPSLNSPLVTKITGSKSIEIEFLERYTLSTLLLATSAQFCLREHVIDLLNMKYVRYFVLHLALLFKDLINMIERRTSSH